MGTKRFFKGLVFGAMAGGFITLLNKETREDVMNSTKKGGEFISRYASDPQLLVESTREVYEKVRETAQQIGEDMEFINSKVEEIKELSPQVKELIEDTKETLHSSSESYKEVFTEEEGHSANNSVEK
ncbi:YtxH domain-containing protein [Rossellomorea vietnamensis]|uniref:YtxH domain-containing protein n=1 Tax=Rossellomorea vietnamensis TaxID=218284 RepID=A0A5D4M0K9_9BACI|nr:YtxH domain-containing protein [Rossellomorea vietnamensis]TYR95329.1 YtxH domain-containing protein [Rossellomorea vietnamensis]